jgi:glucose/arabinose dehydrogenase
VRGGREAVKRSGAGGGRSLFAALAALVLTGACGSAWAELWSKQHLPPPAPPPAAPGALAAKVKLDLVTDQTREALGLYPVPGEAPGGRLFVVEKAGPIRILKGKTLLPAPFLDMTGKVALWSRPNSEQGLLGLAFHPRYLKNGRFFIHYTDIKEGTNRVMEYRVDPKSPDRADPRPIRQWLQVEQPYVNHNAGALEFGPDGKLYVLLGDGGSADDPQGNGQNPKTILSKMVRLDVDSANASPEILGKGMRNPWRYTFDRKTGDLYIADVGQNVWEWVHVIPAARLGATPGSPLNLGWNITEGVDCFKKETCNRQGITAPVVQYPHSEGCSISGGYVYRGRALPELDGVYFYSDFCTAILRSFRYKAGKAVDQWDWKAALDPESRLAKVVAFGQDNDGELYVITHEGPILKLVRR